jgi:hypothetical protein
LDAVGVLATLAISAAVAADKPPVDKTPAVETVVIRLVDGQFLGVAPDRLLRAHAGLPSPNDEFRRLPLAGDRSALATRDNRILAVDRGLLALSAEPSALAGPASRLKIVPAEGSRVLLSPESMAGLPSGPTVELYRIKELPATLRSVLSMVVQGLVVQELKDREYRKERTRQRQRYLDLPAPRLGDLKHTKRVRVLSTTETYEIKARLESTPKLEIGHLPYLGAYGRPTAGVLLFAVRTQVPVSGQVHYEIPKALSMTTGFRATVGLDARGQVGLEKSADELKMEPPKLLQLRVTVDRLDISNDLLNTARALIEDAINHELEKNEDRLREKANASIAKGMASREFHNPLLRFLSLP